MGASCLEWICPNKILCVKALLGNAAPLVETIRFNSRLQYMLIKLQKGTSRERLESIEPDFERCLALIGKDKMTLAILTAEAFSGTSLAPHIEFKRYPTASLSDIHLNSLKFTLRKAAPNVMSVEMHKLVPFQMSKDCPASCHRSGAFQRSNQLAEGILLLLELPI